MMRMVWFLVIVVTITITIVLFLILAGLSVSSIIRIVISRVIVQIHVPMTY